MQQYTTPSDQPAGQRTSGIQLDEFTKYLHEIREPARMAQPRGQGNGLCGRQPARRRGAAAPCSAGMPPAIEPLIGPAIEAVRPGGQDPHRLAPGVPTTRKEGEAAALNYKLNQAERQSGADAACTAAFRTQV